MVGQTLAHFQIVAKLGEGGMGEVYRAEDTKLGREVAIKVLPEGFASDTERIVRFEREARALASLNHPNIASIHEIGRDGDTHFLAMELVPGDTLAERLETGSLPIDEALRHALGISRALEAAHARGVVHRDLKPLNVKITPDGEVKLLDFGLAKVMVGAARDSNEDDETLLAESELTAAGTVLGTTDYMSPEQIRGEDVDQRADIWAFGCVLYEMLAGGRPFARPSAPDTLAAILKEEIDRSSLPAETPGEVRALVDRCLRKRCEQRLHHIADARIEIEQALHGGGGSAASSSGTHSGSVPTPTHNEGAPQRSWKPLVASLLALVVLLTVWKLIPKQSTQPITDRTIAVLPFSTLGQGGPSVFTEGIHGDMLTKLSKIGDLQVTSRTSVMQFRDALTPIPEIADQLGVAWILQGEVQEIADQVQVSARLIDARNDKQVWAESYRRDLTAENLFQIQGDLTREIVDQLAVQLSPEQQQIFDRAPTGDLAAYRLYVQGRALLDPRTERDLARSVGFFRQAIDQDALYGLAWAGLANALALQGFYDYHALDDVLPEALAAAHRALDLDPTLAEGHASMGIVLSLQRKGPETVEALRRSIELNPSFAPSHAWLGWVQDLLGHPEKALPSARRAAELNPLSPAYRAYLAEALMANGEYQEALSQGRRARELQSDYALGFFMEGLALLHLDEAEEATRALSRALELALSDGTPSRPEVLAVLALADSASGNTEAARGRLDEIDSSSDPFAAGLVHAALGETDRALELFASVEEWGFTATPQIRYFFPDAIGAMRQDPRFEGVLEQVRRSYAR